MNNAQITNSIVTAVAAVTAGFAVKNGIDLASWQTGVKEVVDLGIGGATWYFGHRYHGNHPPLRPSVPVTMQLGRILHCKFLRKTGKELRAYPIAIRRRRTTKLLRKTGKQARLIQLRGYGATIQSKRKQ